MTNEKKQKLMRYLYPNDEIRNFMCNDFYQELSEIIPAQMCISSLNKVDKTREINAELVKTKITEFLKDNNNYSIELAKLYHDEHIMARIDDFVMGFVFYLACVKDKFNEIDIFKDKKSICYNIVSIADIL